MNDLGLKRELYEAVASVSFSRTARSRFRRSSTRRGGMLISILLCLDSGDRIRCCLPCGRSFRLWLGDRTNEVDNATWIGQPPTDVEAIEIILRLSE